MAFDRNLPFMPILQVGALALVYSGRAASGTPNDRQDPEAGAATTRLYIDSDGNLQVPDGLEITGPINLGDNVALNFGDAAPDMAIAWDGSKLAVTQAAANSAIHLGVSGAGIDLQFFGDTADRDLLWDQSADALIAADNTKIQVGTGLDLTLRHDASHSYIESITGNLVIDNQAATGATIALLGTDTTAVKFAVQNNSAADLFSVTPSSATAGTALVVGILDLNGTLDLDAALTAAGDAANIAMTINHATANAIALDVSAAAITTARTAGDLIGVRSSITSLTGTTAGVDHVAFAGICTAGDADSDHILLRQGANFSHTIDSRAAATGETNWMLPDAVASALVIQDSAGNDFLLIKTSATDDMSFGNATTNPTYTFLGTGAMSVAGAITAVGVTNNSTLDQNAIIDQDTADTAGTGAAFDSLGTTTSATGSYQIGHLKIKQLTNAKTAGIASALALAGEGLAGDTSGGTYAMIDLEAPTKNGGSAVWTGLYQRAGYTSTINSSAAATGETRWVLPDAVAEGLVIEDSTGNDFLVIDTAAADGMTFGNATTNPLYTFLGSGAISMAGGGAISTGTSQILSDYFVRAVIAVADSAAGVNTVALTLDLYRLDGSTVLGGAKQVMITAVQGTQYQPFVATEASVTYGTATKGTIVAQAAGWCLVETDADGEFDCTVTNTDDETVYFSVCAPPMGVSDSTKGVIGVVSNSDSAAWTA